MPHRAGRKERGRAITTLCAAILVTFGLVPSARGEDGAWLDLSSAVVVAPPAASKVERNALRMLLEAVDRRSGIRWQIRESWPASADAVVIAVGRESALKETDLRLGPWLARNAGGRGSEGYCIGVEAEGRGVLVSGSDARGVLFGVGRLLRELRTGRGRVELPANLRVATAPRLPLRGHQLGYRPKTNSYDGWDLDEWERYMRDLATFGTNAIELIPPRSDDDSTSPHFPRPPMEMMVGMSRLADD
ncbi:MAG TPA: hypothetical protein VGH33_17025, partial [Isosphaeraceae bacterium]